MKKCTLALLFWHLCCTRTAVPHHCTETRRPIRRPRRSWCRRGSPPDSLQFHLLRLMGWLCWWLWLIAMSNDYGWPLSWFRHLWCTQQPYEHTETIGIYQHWRFNTGCYILVFDQLALGYNIHIHTAQAPWFSSPVPRRGTSTTTAAKMQKDCTKGNGDVAPMAKEPQVVSVVTNLTSMGSITGCHSYGAMDLP